MSESISARGAAGARGGSRGRCWGDILGDCSYSCTGRGGRDGGGVDFHDGVPVIIARVLFLMYHYHRPYKYNVFCVFVLVCSLSLLTDGMESKEREREEN